MVDFNEKKPRYLIRFKSDYAFRGFFGFFDHTFLANVPIGEKTNFLRLLIQKRGKGGDIK